MIIYVYLPRSKVGNNVISLLFRDLQQCSLCPDQYVFIHSIWELIRLRIRLFFQEYLILVPHQSLLRSVSIIHPFQNIALWFTHYDPRTNISLKKIQNLRALLCISSIEYTQFSIFLPKANVMRFPLGINLALWGLPSDNIINFPNAERSIDVLISCNYRDEKFYAGRKNYDLIIKSSNYLVQRGLKVHVNGSGWNTQCSKFDRRVVVTSVHYLETPELFRRSKIFLLLSRYEGGNTATLEALASGCMLLSTPSGFTIDFLDVGEPSVTLLTTHSSLESIYSKITHMLKNNTSLEDVRQIDDILKISDFAFLDSCLRDLQLEAFNG